MNVKVPIAFVALLLIFSSIAIAVAAQPSSNSTKTVFTNSVPGNLYPGNLIIYSNGQVSNATLISQAGNTYYLEANLSGTLTVLSNNSVFNGNGFVMDPIYRYSVYVNNTVGVTLTDINIISGSGGISIYNSYNFNLQDSKVIAANTALYFSASSKIYITSSNISVPSGYGVYLQQSPVFTMTYSTVNAQYDIYTQNSTTQTKFSSDFLMSSVAGVCLYGSINNFVNVDNSTFVGNGTNSVGVYVESGISDNDVIRDNNFRDFTANNPFFAALVISTLYGVNCKISNNTFQSDTNSIFAGDEINVTISHNYFDGTSGITVNGQYCQNIFVSWNVFSNFTSSATHAIELDDNGQAALVSHNVINPDASSVSSTFVPIYIDYSNSANVSYNTITNSSKGIDLEDLLTANVLHNTAVNVEYGIYINFTSSANVSYNTIMNCSMRAINLEYLSTASVLHNTGVGVLYGIYIVAYSMDNVRIAGNSFSAGSSIGCGIIGGPLEGTNWVVNNNTISGFAIGIKISYDVTNLTISRNHIYNASEEAIYSDFNFNTNISWNVIVNTNTPLIDAIYVDYSVIGTVISHNTILSNALTGGDGISIYESSPVLVYDNSVTNATCALDIEYSGYVTSFNNMIRSSEYGLNSINNIYDTFYGNSVINSTSSLSSLWDYGTVYYSNTFQNAALLMLNIRDSVNITFYHNNFLNGTNISTYLFNNTNLLWNLSLPVGGNYWSNYTGTFSGRFGTSPYVLNRNNIDYLPLKRMWKEYTVTFIEQGLPSGTTWSVTLGTAGMTSNGMSIAFSPQVAQLVNQTFTVGKVSGYIASSASGSVYLNGSSHVITITFTPYTYDVTFTESNLPAGTAWSVTLNGNTETSTTSTVIFSVPNGTYSYTIGSVTGYHTSAASGTVTVNSASQSVSVAFSENMYSITVNEKGLPSGDAWTYTFNGTAHTSISNVIVLYSISGTFAASVSGPSGYSASAASNVTVDYANITVNVTFSLIPSTPEYTVLVTENGLASGSIWSFVLNGKSYTTNLSALIVHVVAGTYSINASGPTGYNVSVQKSLTVSNTNTTVTVTFTQIQNGTTPPAKTSPANLYIGLGAGVVIGAVVASIALMLFTGTGIFRNLKKGKGGNP